MIILICYLPISPDIQNVARNVIKSSIEQMSRHGGILISESTHSAIDHTKHKFHPFGPIALKGKKQQIKAYSLIQ